VPGSVSKEELETARFKLSSSRAETRISSARVAEEQARVEELSAQLGKSVVRAPFAGSTTLRYVDEGSIVKPGQPIVRLLSTGGQRIRFAVPPEQSARTVVGRALRFVIPALGLTLAGKVTHTAREVDPASQLVFVEAEVAGGDDERLKAGLVGRVHLLEVASAGASAPAPRATPAGSPAPPAARPAGSPAPRAPAPAPARP